jgi:aspartate racemase
VRAGIYYYEQIARAYQERDKALRLFFVHAEIRTALAYMRAGRVRELMQYLLSLVQSLEGAGAAVAAISAVTPHVCIDELLAASPIPIVNILPAIDTELREREVRRVAIYGTRYVVETDLFGALPSVEVVRPKPEEIDEIHAIYTELAQSGKITAAQRERLALLANFLFERERIEAIVIAGTDLSAIYADDEPGFPVVDASKVHVRAITEVLWRS